MKKDFMFTCESVTEGHPDKLCDRISDAIVDRFLQQDPYSRIITECAVATSIVFIAARFASDAVVDLAATARKTIERVGYHQPDFNSKTCSIITSIKEFPASADRSVEVGGPSVHSGLTGRKTAIDTYGEYARHSGSALSGKDPTRIDRIGAYAARYAAKNVVAAGLAAECEVQLSYSIGLVRPVSLQVETFGTGQIADTAIADLIAQHFEFRPAGILRQFDLRFLPALVKGGFYSQLAAYGHFGRLDLGVLPWEETDQVDLLQTVKY